MGHVLLWYLPYHHYHQLNQNQIVGQPCPPFLIFAICLWQSEFERAIPSTMITNDKNISYFLLAHLWVSGFPISHTCWDSLHLLPKAGEQQTLRWKHWEMHLGWNSHGCIKDFFFFLATLDHLCASFLGECRIKQSLLRGSFHLLNHGLFFPLDITCYFRVHFQKVLNGLAQNWLCIKGKNQCPRVSISTSANRPLTCPEVLGGCQWQ